MQFSEDVLNYTDNANYNSEGEAISAKNTFMSNNSLSDIGDQIIIEEVTYAYCGVCTILLTGNVWLWIIILLRMP